MPIRPIIAVVVEETPEGVPVAVVFEDIMARCNTYKRIIAITNDEQPVMFSAVMN